MQRIVQKSNSLLQSRSNPEHDNITIEKLLYLRDTFTSISPQNS